MAKTLAIPTTADELREMLTDRSVMKELMADPEKFAEFTEASINARLKKDPDILAQVEEQTQAFMIKWLRDNQPEDVTARRLNLDNPNARTRIRPNTVYNKQALGATKDTHGDRDKFFESPSAFVHSISQFAFKDSALTHKLETLKNDLSSLKPSDGGFLIPEMLRAELLRVALDRAIVRSRARVIPMDSLTVPFPAIDSTSNVSSIYGGVTGFWTEEGATLVESQPRFGRVELRAQKLTLYTEVPNELLRDARPALDAFINDIFPEAIAWFEDVAFFIGGGVGEPLGFLNAPGRVDVTRNGGGNAVEWIDIVSMYARLLPQSLDRAVWVVSPDTLPSIFQMTMTGGSSPVMLGGGQFATGSAAPPMTMLGLPIIVSEKARAAGSAGDVNLVDFGFYLVGDRQAMSARQSEEFAFNRDVTAFRVIERVDGRPWLLSPITPQNGSSNTLSAYVKLS